MARNLDLLKRETVGDAYSYVCMRKGLFLDKKTSLSAVCTYMHRKCVHTHLHICMLKGRSQHLFLNFHCTSTVCLEQSDDSYGISNQDTFLYAD